MRVTLFGTRGSIPAPGPETTRYGGNTPAVEVRAKNGAMLAFDAGTGIRRLGAQVSPATARIDILLTHLHMDHIQGLGRSMTRQSKSTFGDQPAAHSP
jgi:phosphoribosyl 1,2-cyclic phosphodiesterase